MNPQTIGEPVVNGSNGASNKSGGDPFVDAALDFLSNEGASENDNGTAPTKPVKKPPKKAPEPKPEPDDGEPDDGEEEEDESAKDAPGPGDEGEGDEDEGEPEDTRGSKEEPFSIKDLPKDKYIELKVDGEKLTVSLEEMAQGYVREQTFSRRINKTKMMADQAQALYTHVNDVQTRLRTELHEFLHDADELYNFFLDSDEREQVLEAVATKYAKLRQEHRLNPEQRLMFQRQRDKARLARERQAYEENRRAEEQQRQQREGYERAMAIFKPGWDAGLRKAGFPTPTQALRDEVMIRCSQKAQRGEPVTSDDVADFVVRAAKILELPPAGAKKPQPAPQSIRPATPRRERGGKDWAKMTPQERRADPDYFLRNLRPRDLRLR